MPVAFKPPPPPPHLHKKWYRAKVLERGPLGLEKVTLYKTFTRHL